MRECPYSVDFVYSVCVVQLDFKHFSIYEAIAKIILMHLVREMNGKMQAMLVSNNMIRDMRCP